MKSLFLVRLAIVLAVAYTITDFAIGYGIESKTTLFTLIDTLQGIKTFQGKP
jgi:hypothetical protein